MTSETTSSCNDMRQWWTSKALQDCRANIVVAVDTTFQQLTRNIMNKGDRPDCTYAKALVAGIMPPRTNQIESARALSCIDGRPPELSDSPSSIKYTGTPQKDEIAYATMLHSWITESCMITSGSLSYRTQFHPVKYDLKISELHQPASRMKHCHDVAGDIKLRDGLNTMSESDCHKYRYQIDSAWMVDPEMLSLRRAVVGALTEMVESSLNALSEQQRELLRKKEAMKKVFDLLEPRIGKGIVQYCKYNDDLVPCMGPTVHLLSIIKDWWSEVRDMYIYGIEPPLPFDISVRAQNIFMASLKMEHGNDFEYSSSHLAKWYFDHKHFPYMFTAIKGEADLLNSGRISIFPTPIQIDIDKWRAFIPGTKVLSARWSSLA